MEETKPKRRGPAKPVYYVVEYHYDRHTGEEDVSVFRFDELPECCQLLSGLSQFPAFSAPWTEDARIRLFTYLFGNWSGHTAKPVVVRIGEDDRADAWLCDLIDLPPWRKRPSPRLIRPRRPETPSD